jgi:hypothetical protein
MFIFGSSDMFPTALSPVLHSLYVCASVHVGQHVGEHAWQYWWQSVMGGLAAFLTAPIRRAYWLYRKCNDWAISGQAAQQKRDAAYARGGLPPCVRRRVHDYIAAHLDQKITNDALAQIAGLSTAHFCTAFKQTEGVSPRRYVVQYRVGRARQLLISAQVHTCRAHLKVCSRN